MDCSLDADPNDDRDAELADEAYALSDDRQSAHATLNALRNVKNESENRIYRHVPRDDDDPLPPRDVPFQASRSDEAPSWQVKLLEKPGVVQMAMAYVHCAHSAHDCSEMVQDVDVPLGVLSEHAIAQNFLLTSFEYLLKKMPTEDA
jgi:hypothetical protein